MSLRTSSVLEPFFRPKPDTGTVITAFALGAIGAILFPLSARCLSWFRLHFLHRSKLARYNHTSNQRLTSTTNTKSTSTSSVTVSTTVNEPSTTHNDYAWALVTGASDGIGAGFVSELASHNFNIILHGRNPSKLSKQVTNLQAQFPHLKFETWIVDATARGETWTKAFTTLKDLISQKGIHLAVLVNNIGGTPDPDTSFTTLSRYDDDGVNTLIDMNVTFPAQVTRLLLPDLIANKPSLILNMSSMAAMTPMPYLGLYGGSKAFNLQFSKMLRMEMIAEGHGEVEVLGIKAARVQSAGSGAVKVDWTTPSSAQFARSVLGMVGCGRGEIMGWWGHDIQLCGMALLPEWLAEWVIVLVSRKEKKAREEGKR